MAAISDLSNLLNEFAKMEGVGLDFIRAVRSGHAGNARNRVHVDGLDNKGQKFGKYSDSYYKYVRPKYNRIEPQDKKVLSLTSEMEKEFGLAMNISSGDGTIEFTQPENINKYQYLVEKYGEFYAPTNNELEMIEQNADLVLQEIINNKIQ